MRSPLYSDYTITTDRPGHVDLAMSIGTPVVAIRPGTVVWAGWDGGHGFHARVLESDGTTIYAHLYTLPLVSEGDRVSAGYLLGHSGSTGRSSGPHLHIASSDPFGRSLDPLRSPRDGTGQLVAIAAAVVLTIWLVS